ncbi:unnamed protein product [Xylocopa violacea]|uniref:Uncharacterized protein n=1 Tax=Xylocopa violacea TaxID=135666 RepID=A0ABP1PB73_XYLVO
MRFDPLSYCFGRKNKINDTAEGKAEEGIPDFPQEVIV